ncbi:ABC transporter [Sphingobium yanoikuyae]|jgi:ABC-type multidrug transport system ATPase subunit|uniref:ABC transporter n=1 Tax=Sphingobium yanoikuyae TaxID=13690 RepID=A0A177JWT0_SPHYA|nr:ABC transporter ATP-binding protein [Sphingobium yanoikuyae]OAH45374.1 ABC transporter [Sphingobium yanoikuyae]
MRPGDGIDHLVGMLGVGKRFGGRWVIRDLTFSLDAGAMLGLVGANGGGKTTTLRMLAGLLKPDSGGGIVLGHDLRRPSGQMRRDIGYMSQRLSLYPELTVAENLAFRATALGLKDRHAIIEAAVDRYGLGDLLRTRFDRLSGGWARRAQFVAVTLASPKLLLLDEPTAGLDVATRRAIWSWLGDFARAGHVVVVSTHDLAEAQLCPAILHYSDGLAEGPMPPAGLIARAGAVDLEDAVLRLAGGTV